MPPGRARVTGHKIYAPFRERAYSNDRVQRGWGHTHLPLVNLACVTETDSKNVILENRGPKITSAEDLLGSSITKHVTTTGARVVVTQDSFSFFERQTTAEN